MLMSGNHHLQRSEITAFVCSFVPSLSEALNFHLLHSDSLQEHSESIKGAFREHSDGTNRTQIE